MRENNGKTRRETFKLWDLVRLILEVWWYLYRMLVEGQWESKDHFVYAPSQ